MSAPSSPTASASSPTVVRWRFSPATTRSLRLPVYAAVGLTVGPVLGLLALVGATLVRSDVGVALVALVLALFVGLGIGSGRALFALGSAPPEVHETVRALSRWGVASGVLVGAGLALVGLRWTEFGVELIVAGIVTGFACLSVGAGLRTEGVVDCEARELVYYGHTVPLDAVRRVRALRLGPFVLALLAYHRGRVSASTPRFVVLSSEAVAAVRASADESAAGSDAGERASTAVRAVAAAFGVACLAAGPVLWLVLPPEGRLFAGYLGAFGLLFGVVFVRYALVA